MELLNTDMLQYLIYGIDPDGVSARSDVLYNAVLLGLLNDTSCQKYEIFFAQYISILFFIR